jgi:leucyl aminopeptidase
MFNLSAADGGVIVGVAVGLVSAGLFLRHYLTRTTPISSVHAGKQDTCKTKFDRNIVNSRARRLKGPPKIDLSNLPAPHPEVVRLMKSITVADITRELNEFTGEADTTVKGQTVRITSRNSFHKLCEIAMQKLEEDYAAIGVTTRRIKYVKRGRTLYSLEATIPGVDRTKVCIVGSHIDSTAGNTNSAENVAPGADDDGSGSRCNITVARKVIELMKATGKKPAFDLRFCHFSGEEQGLWGSYVYSDQCAAGKENVYVYQMDMIAYCAKPGNRVDIHDDVNRNGSHLLVERLARTVARYKLDLTVNDTHDHAVTDRSDQAGFLDHGYMAVLISEEFSDDGFNPNYHSTGDRVKNCNIPFMVENIRMLFGTVAADLGLDA